MNTQQLESFIQVAENLNFARAAEVLKITQSAVSRQIHSLEDELGAKLLHRSTRTVTLTPAGISFLEDAKNVMGRLQIAAAKIQNHMESNMQVISIGCSSEADLDLLTKILKTCREQIPDLHPFLRVIPHRSILNLFYHGELDTLFGFYDDIPTREGMIYKELVKIPLCCALPVSHPYAQKTEIDEVELYSQNIITCHSYAIPSKAAEMQNRIAGHLLPGSTNICENLQVILALIRSGYGCSILPKVNFPIPEINYVPIRGSSPLSYGIFYKNDTLSPLLKKFITIVDSSPRC